VSSSRRSLPDPPSHGQNNAAADINGGKMDGFVGQLAGAEKGCADPNNPACTNSATPDVLGYHTR